MKKRNAAIDYGRGDITALYKLLSAPRSFVVSLLENPILLEHEAFTDLLWATFHLADELAHRKSFNALALVDQRHLALDIQRVYGLVLHAL